MNDLMPPTVNKINGPQGVLGAYGALSRERNPATMTSADLANIAGPSVGATSYTPNDDALTSKTLTRLLNTDNPYMQQARTRAAQYSANRGLNNSSIAAGAGESAAIDAAMPIAQSDANAFLTSQRDNAAASNQFGMAQNNFMRQGALSIAGAGWDRENKQADMAFRSGESALERQFTAGRDITLGNQRLAEIGAQTDATLRQYDARDRSGLGADYRAHSQRTYDDYTSEVNKIEQGDMDPDVKAAQVRNLQGLYETRQTFVNAIYSNAPQWASEWSQIAIDWNGG